MVSFIQYELQSFGSCAANLDTVGGNAKRGKALRLRLCYGKSPNRVQYLDGYDNFKPFAFETQGCIDGDTR